MFTLLVGCVVVASGLLVLLAIRVDGLTRDRNARGFEVDRLIAERDHLEGLMARKLTAAEKRLKELERDNAHFGDTNRQLADELAGERAQVGHLTEVGTGLHHAIKARDELLGNMVEALDESRTLLARLHGLAEQAKGLIHSRRTS